MKRKKGKKASEGEGKKRIESISVARRYPASTSGIFPFTLKKRERTRWKEQARDNFFLPRTLWYVKQSGLLGVGEEKRLVWPEERGSEKKDRDRSLEISALFFFYFFFKLNTFLRYTRGCHLTRVIKRDCGCQINFIDG